MSNYSWQDNNDSGNQNGWDPNHPDTQKGSNDSLGQTQNNNNDNSNNNFSDGNNMNANDNNVGNINHSGDNADNNNSNDYGRYSYGQYGDNQGENRPGNFDGYQQDNPNSLRPNNPYSYDQNPQNYGDNNYGRNYREPGSPGMATASLVLGICSILFTCCGLGMPLAGIGLVLAILSRGRGEMNNSAKIGLGLSVGGFILGLITTIMGFFYIDRVMKTIDWDDINNYGYEYDMRDYDDLRDYFSDISQD